jgi:hypothetical protein
MARSEHIELAVDELRAIAGYATDCAEPVLDIFERAVPGDSRARDAIIGARAFADGGRRTMGLRSIAMAAFRAAHDAPTPAAAEAARAASAAAAAAYLHPVASADQIKHILGAAAHAARAAELDTGDDPSVGATAIAGAVAHAPSTVASVLARYPRAPSRGGRIGELVRAIDAALRR